MKKTWWIVLILVVIGFLWYKSVFKASQNSPTGQKVVSAKGTFEVETRKVNYFEKVEGFLAKPSKAGAYPGVVMIHDDRGLNDNIKEEAKSLASFGYSVLAVDLYNGVVAQTPEEAKKQIGSLDQEVSILNMSSAAKFLKENEKATKIASLGFGFGGGQSLKFSLSKEKLDATVIFYGNLLLEEKKLKPITWPVLGIFAEKDKLVPVESARIFDTVLTKIGTPHEIAIYTGVGNDFLDPANSNYSQKEAGEAWMKTVQFLEDNLKK
jgi:carboxymethylenebutenolidase